MLPSFVMSTSLHSRGDCNARPSSPIREGKPGSVSFAPPGLFLLSVLCPRLAPWAACFCRFAAGNSGLAFCGIVSIRQISEIRLMQMPHFFCRRNIWIFGGGEDVGEIPASRKGRENRGTRLPFAVRIWHD